MIARRRPDLATFERRTAAQGHKFPAKAEAQGSTRVSVSFRSGQRTREYALVSRPNVILFAGQPIESNSSCKLVCLSASLRWAWLQGNSRARQLRSPVPALAGFGFPCRLPAAPFEPHKQSALDPPKNRFACLESGPLRTGSPQRIGARKEDKNMLCKNRITLIGFLGQHAETRSTPNGAVYTRFSLATSVSWKEKNSDDYKRVPNGTVWSAGTSWAPGLALCRKGLTSRSKANSATVNLLLRSLIAAYAWRRSTPPRFWRWTAPINNPLPKLSIQS
jgi:hypothetical protein